MQLVKNRETMHSARVVSLDARPGHRWVYLRIGSGKRKAYYLASRYKSKLGSVG